MDTDSNESIKSINGTPCKNREVVGYDLVWFLSLAALAYVAQIAAILFLGLYWGAGFAILVFVVWVYFMPTTCMNGGLICSFVAMMLLTNTIAICVVAGIRLLKFLLS